MNMKKKFRNLQLGIVGDIHGDFQTFQSVIKHLNDTVIIVAGDCGFGFEQIKYIVRMRKKQWDAFLEKRNLYVFFLRGNHDNPNWFDPTSSFNTDLSTERFCLIPDYTIIQIDETKILCVGGGVSIDKDWRTYGKTMWYGENISLKGHYLPNKKIDILVTHAVDIRMLSMAFKDNRRTFSEEIQKELNEEGEICRALYLIYKPKLWLHGHHHQSCISYSTDVTIKSLNCNELYEIRLNSK